MHPSKKDFGGSNVAEQARLRETLLKEKDRLQQELAEVEKDMPSLREGREGSLFGNREEEAVEASEMERRLAMKTKLNQLIAEVDRALEKLNQGSYGRCDLCREPINPERLEALPPARLCLKCRADQDKARTRR